MLYRNSLVTDWSKLVLQEEQFKFRRQFYLERLEYWERFFKSKAAGCGSISTVISSIVLLCVSSIIIIIIIIMMMMMMIIIIITIIKKIKMLEETQTISIQYIDFSYFKKVQIFELHWSSLLLTPLYGHRLQFISGTLHTSCSSLASLVK